MASDLTLSEAEALEAIAAATSGTTPKQAKTVQDIMGACGLSRDVVRRALGRLAMQNRLEVHQVRRPDLSGRINQRPAYVVLPKKRK